MCRCVSLLFSLPCLLWVDGNRKAHTVIVCPVPSHASISREDGFSPDVWTYSNLIRGLAGATLWRRAVAMLDDMLQAVQEGEEGSVMPDAHCFNAAISGCAKVRSDVLFMGNVLTRRGPELVWAWRAVC